MAYVNSSYLLQQAKSLANGLTKEPITGAIPCRAGDSPIVCDIKVTSGTGTIYIQDSSDGFDTVVDKKSVSVTGAGTFSITLLAHNSSDQAHFPLRNAIRLAMTTTSAVVIEEVRVCLEK